MRKRVAIPALAFAAAAGAFVMLVALEFRHEYAQRQLAASTERIIELRDLRTGDPPRGVPPTSEDMERARAVCEPLSRETGLSFREIAALRYFLAVDIAEVDHEALHNSSDILDRLRITLFGLSSRDEEVARSSIRGIDREREARQFAAPLKQALASCGYLAGEMKVVE